MIDSCSPHIQRLVIPGAGACVSLSVLLLAPGDWKLRYGVEGRWSEGNYSASMAFETPDPQPGPPKGTLVLLHGYGQSKESLLHWGLFLGQAGYRCILVDLRGHGDSGGRWLGFGAFEAQDLRHLMDVLESRKLISGPVGVLGISYGASVGLRWAAEDHRVRAVVALEPFSDPESAIRTMIENFPPFKRKLRWVRKGALNGALAIAPVKAGFRWGDVQVQPVMRSLRIPVFILHGAADVMVPPAQSEVLLQEAPAGSRRWLLPGEDHISLALRLEPMAKEVRNWLDTHLGAGFPAVP